MEIFSWHFQLEKGTCKINKLSKIALMKKYMPIWTLGGWLPPKRRLESGFEIEECWLREPGIVWFFFSKAVYSCIYNVFYDVL